MLMVMGLMVGVGCGGKEIEVVKKDNEEYEIYRDETNNKPIKHGFYKEYYPDKSYKTTGNFVDGKQEGKWVWYDEDGEVEGEKNYVDGKPEVKSVIYYETGEVWVEGNYVNGKEEGAWVEYYENGKVKDEDIYQNGVCVDLCEGDE